MKHIHGAMNRFLYSSLAVVLSVSTLFSISVTATETQVKKSSSNNTETISLDMSASEDNDEPIMDNYNYLEQLYNNLSEEEAISFTQLNSINMLNYMSSLSQKISAARGDQFALEDIYQSLDNDIYPNSVDKTTQTQMNNLTATIKKYRMIDTKRKRLEYIHDKAVAQAYRNAIPNPIGLLSAVQSGNLLKAAASVLYMTIDSASKYKEALNQADMQFLESGWQLDDEETEELFTSTQNARNYMLDTVRTYNIPGDYALNRESIEQFITWASKPDSQIDSKIAWLESNRRIYSKFGSYWLELAKNYYQCEEFDKCYEAIKEYESVATRIFRQDHDYATAIPMAIISAEETLEPEDYIKKAGIYCDVLVNNIKDADWSLRYFAAQIYLDLYARTDDKAFLEKAYDAALYNVNVLANMQRSQNASYLADIVEENPGKGATDLAIKEAKQYNKLQKEERKTALPPVNEALYLSCDLLFALADECGITTKEKAKIDSILHESGEPIFLSQYLDDRFWFNNPKEEIALNDIEILFDGERLTVPISCVSDRSTIRVEITWDGGSKVLEDWAIKEVTRPKKGTYQNYTATYTSKTGKDSKYKVGDKIVVTIVPVAETPEETIEFTYNVVSDKKALVFDGIKFERQYE